MKTATLATRRWWYIMPIVFITYSLAYLDRANYGFAAASGMAAVNGALVSMLKLALLAAVPLLPAKSV